MIERLTRFALLALAAITFLAKPAEARDAARIVAVGDLHGDYSAWLDIARDARLIDSSGHWAGGPTILIQLGDVTDRGPDSLRIIRSLQQLQKQAPRSGGKVVTILGNHEAMNLLGDYRYTTPGEYAVFVDAQSAALRDRVYENDHVRLEALYRARNPTITPAQAKAAWMAEFPLGWVEHRRAWKPTGELGGWAVRNPAVVKLGDTLFVHGGISAEYAKLSLEEINRRVREAMLAIADPGSILDDPLGPLWYRGLVGDDPEADAARKSPKPTIDQELTAVLGVYGAKRIVVGHTPNLAGIAIRNGGRLIQVDTGISRFYGGPLTWLEIVGDRITPHTVARTTP